MQVIQGKVIHLIFEQACNSQSYASLKLQPSVSRTGVKCRTTDIANKTTTISSPLKSAWTENYITVKMLTRRWILWSSRFVVAVIWSGKAETNKTDRESSMGGGEGALLVRCVTIEVIGGINCRCDAGGSSHLARLPGTQNSGLACVQEFNVPRSGFDQRNR